MNVLGITSSAESGAALFIDDLPVAAVNEERLSRKKLDGSYPHLAIDWCLQSAGLTPEKIDRICYGFSQGFAPGETLSGLFERAIDGYGNDPEALQIIKERLVVEHRVDAQARDDFFAHTRNKFPATIPIHHCNHHETHRAAAFFPSPFARALVITADGRGDYLSLTISRMERNPNRTELLYRAYNWESLGYLYGRVTHLCGFTPNRHEGKVMGLSAVGNPEVALPLMRRMIDLDASGRIKSHPGPYYRPFFTHFSDALLQEAALFSREDLAAAVQRHLETIVLELLTRFLNQTGLRHVCMAGGVFSNVKLNQKIRELPGCDEVFVYPNMTDGGICAGAVYDWMFKNNRPPHPSFPSLYLGPRIDVEKLRNLLEQAQVHPTRPEPLIATVCQLLDEEKVIGLVQGGGEFGPRALGNRSMLCSPRNPGKCDEINQRLSRSEFMPFAPSIAEELAERCLVGYASDAISARHMTLSFHATEEMARTSPAVVHVDQSVRPQVVRHADNPFFHDLLLAWHQKTGVSSLLNTSFNRHEEAILSSEEDVLAAVKEGFMDALVFPPYLLIL
ncbi:MAG: carbamoyl transferase [Magnetococcales bacterium]|nr:carbamoyl transferase [Magnetococcales bacterium]MBF0629525.1 carbamoyl transferase [Magnetococcales bacterium]